jgi:hypothetical protein
MPQEIQQPNIFMDIGARIRILENKYNTVNEHLLIINQNMIEEYKKSITEIKILNDEMKEIKQDVINVKETIKKMIKEMDIFARKDELKVLEKYINLWNPIQFVTEDQLNRVLEEKKGGKTGGKKR